MVSISRNFQWWVEQYFPKFTEKQAIYLTRFPEIFGSFLIKISYPFDFPSAVWIRFAISKTNNSQQYPDFMETLLGNFCTIYPLFETFRLFFEFEISQCEWGCRLLVLFSASAAIYSKTARSVGTIKTSSVETTIKQKFSLHCQRNGPCLSKDILNK